MFGASNGQDTTGYGGLRSPILLPGASQRPYGGYFDDLADALERALVGGSASYAEAVERVTIDRGEMTVFVRREHLLAVARALRDDPDLRFELCLGVSGVHYPHETGRELHAVYHFLSITNDYNRIRIEVTCPDADPHVPSIVCGLPRERLARAGDVGHVRDPVRRPPGPHADPHAGRLARPPAAQGLPARRHPRRVQGRDDPAARPAQELQLMAPHKVLPTTIPASPRSDGDPRFAPILCEDPA